MSKKNLVNQSMIQVIEAIIMAEATIFVLQERIPTF